MKGWIFAILIAVAIISGGFALSASICHVPYAEGICCEQYASDYRWPSGNGLCCNGQPYYTSDIYCSSSETSCAGVSCPSGCGTGNVAQQNGWCSDGQCNYYSYDCDWLDGCVSDSYVSYSCGGADCVPASDSCSDCSCPDDGGVQQTCGGYNIPENVTNKNCFDGKDNDCDGKCDSFGCSGLPPDPECGLLIESMDDITKYCPYNTTSRTYSCTGGWNNIYVQNDVSLPSVDCWGGDLGPCDNWELGSCNPTNIVFKANNEFSAKNFYASNRGGYGGSITIEAKKIKATSLNTYGSECHSSSCTCGGPFCGSNYGGPINLKADVINVGSLNANDGRGRGGSGGTITVVANTTNINSISSSGAAYYCSYDYGYDDGPGSGGYVNIKSKQATFGTISLSGGGSSYEGRGGSGGSARLEVDNLILSGGIDSNGASVCGSGGAVTLLSSDGKISGALSALGQYEARWWDDPGCSGSNGYFRIGSDYLKSTGTLTTNGPGSGGSIKLYLDTYNVSSVSSGSVAFLSNNTPQNRAFLSAGSLKISGRSKTALFGFNTSIPDLSAKSFQMKIKETSGAYFKSYGTEWSETGTMIQPGKVSTEVGRDMPITGFMGGKKYYFELTTSTDAEFEASRCTSGAAACSSYDIGFVEWS